ncbi:serine hydrolase domain-containing protein [Sinomicrobium oceani]|uniref:serine hydrolase domain-containing protein n=1 Tax=Sinomicrobium oceani TaxID=1150368 RepID=UPI00227BF684|nr:serine hydrolase domain-containing protein [Sinomicrobium oceani]
MRKKVVLVLIVILIFQLSVTGQSLELKIDSVLNEKYKAHAPGGVFLVSRNGKTIYNKAFGLSDIELGTPMKTDNVFELGSITKQFTAISVLMLVDNGKLELDDTVSSYVPDYPNGEQITIHHLLTHTSGIKDFTRIKGLTAIAKEELSSEELINFFKNEPVDFPPGERYEYCNAGYMLLGYIIEVVSGKEYQDFVAHNIFERLGMHNSYYASHQKIIRNRASGYSEEGDHYVNNRYISFSIPFSAGALMSTVDDMLKWQEAVKKYTLLSRRLTKKVFTDHSLNNGKLTGYGYGWHINVLNGVRSFEHGGSIFGYKSMGVYLPDEDIYVIGLTNCSCNSPTEVSRTIAGIVQGYFNGTETVH